MSRKQITLGTASIDPCGDPEGIVTDPSELVCHASLVLLVKQAADLLEKQYPGWAWAITPDEAGGVINLHSFMLSGTWGYTLCIGGLQADPQLRKVVKAGGELLERFGMPPGPFNRDRWLHMKRHLGLPVADVSDLAKKHQRGFRTDQIRRAVNSGAARITTDARIGAALAART